MSVKNAKPTNLIAASDVLRCPEQVALQNALDEVKPHAECLVQHTSDGSAEEVLKVVGGSLSSEAIGSDAIDAVC